MEKLLHSTVPQKGVPGTVRVQVERQVREERVLLEGMSGPQQGPSGHNPIYSFLEISTNEPILSGKVGSLEREINL